MKMTVWWDVKHHIKDSFVYQSHIIKNYTIMADFHPIAYIADIETRIIVQCIA